VWYLNKKPLDKFQPSIGFYLSLLLIFAIATIFFGQYSLYLGIAEAFVVIILALISAVVSLISRLINRDQNTSTSGHTRRAQNAVTQPVIAKTSKSASVSASNPSPDLIAVIAAAIAAYRTEDGQRSTAGFLVRRIRRV